jgi:hypothetical protein
MNLDAQQLKSGFLTSLVQDLFTRLKFDVAELKHNLNILNYVIGSGSLESNLKHSEFPRR